jgi:DNA-directed RNA polymerase subunit M/transcription elongation factor TFIIS
MEQSVTAGRSCPACGSTDCLFRGRKKVALEPGVAVETKYRCKACNHEWKERLPAGA